MFDDVVIPARFALTVGHLWALTLFQFHLDDTLRSSTAAYSSTSSLSTTDLSNSIYAFSFFSYLCLAIDLCGLLTGYSAFLPKVNIVQIACHFAGGILMSWQVCYEWTYVSLWFIFLFCSVPTLLAEIASLFYVFVLRLVKY